MPKLLNVLFYIGFMLVTLFFVRKSVEECLSGDMAYDVKEVPVTLDDLPTLTICLESDISSESVTYGQDFSIDLVVKVKEDEKVITLVEDQNVRTMLSLEIRLSRFWQRLKREKLYLQENKQNVCYKITSIWIGNELINLHDLLLQFILNFQTKSKFRSLKVKLSFTSEEDSYWLSDEPWFDGNIEEFITSSTHENNYLHGSANDMNFEVLDYDIQVTQINNIESTCSPESSYKCYAEHFARLASHKEDGLYKAINSSEFHLCKPFSMPLVDKKIAFCKDETDRAYFEMMVSKIEEKLRTKCGMSCNSKHYKVRSIAQFDNNGSQLTSANHLSFRYKFGTPQGSRFSGPIKLIRQGYHVSSWLGTVGNVGGTFGLFLGFSFLSVFRWLTAMAKKIFCFLKKTKFLAPNIFDMKYSTMKIKSAMQAILYLGLFLSGLFCVQESFSEYRQGRSSYYVIKEPLKQNELPTLTSCLVSHYGRKKLLYGSDFFINITFHQSEYETSILLDNSSFTTMSGYNIHFKELMQSRQKELYHQRHLAEFWQCFNITIASKVLTVLKEFGVRLDYIFADTEIMPSSVKVWVTSEENAYGLTNENWHDGSIEMINGNEIILPYQAYTEIEIFEVDEFQNLEPGCSHESYYDCLATRFTKFTTNHTGKHVCTPFSLPVDYRLISTCKNEDDREIWEKVISELLAEQDIQCKKACNVKQFKTKVGKIDLSFEGSNNRAAINYKFVPPFVRNRDVRTLKPFKYKHIEYLVMPMMTLIGNVGGILGLFVGFSFANTYKWCVASMGKALLQIKSGESAKIIKKLPSLFTVRVKLLFETLLLTALLLGAILFSSDTVLNYKSGRTTYSESKKPITLEDLPTFTICFILPYELENYTHGKDFIINLTVSGDNGHWLKLQENEYTSTSFSLSVHLSKLRQTSRIEQKHKDAGNSPIAWAEKWQCFKVSFQWHGNLDLDMKKFKAKLIFQFVPARCPMKGIFVLFLNKKYFLPT